MAINKNDPVKMKRYEAIYTDLLERALGINNSNEEENEEFDDGEQNSSRARKRVRMVVPDTPPSTEPDEDCSVREEDQSYASDGEDAEEEEY